MLSNKSFRIAFIISLIAHGAILIKPPRLDFLSPSEPLKKIEVTYLKLKKEIVKTKGEISKREIDLRSNQKNKSKELPPPFLKKDELFKGKLSQLLKKPRLIRPDIIEVKKIIQLKPLPANKINNPSYITYYQIIREKIKRCAYKNYTRSDTGQAYLTFVILSDGTLNQAKIVDEKSTANTYLKEIALRSIKDASPYPAFPKELEYPHLSFNVIISFEIE